MKLSFVIPSYNSAAWLSHAIVSAQKQTHPNIEIVVVDDASTDSTQKFMEFICEKDARIKYLRLLKNLGRSAARNHGNKMATGDYIAVLDADDIAYPERAALTVKALQKADFVHGSCDYIDAIGTKLGTHYADVFSREKALREGVNRIVHSTCAYTKKLALRFPYEGAEAAKLGLDDYVFQLAVSASGAKMDHITQVVGAYRDIPSGVSKTRDHTAVVAFKKAYAEALTTNA